MRIKLAIFMSMFILLLVTPLVSATEWWDESWSYRRPLTVSIAHPDNYQLAIKIAYDDNMNVDFSDLRFIEGGVELSYWIENIEPLDFADVWVRRLENSNLGGDFWVYYGNSGASTSSDIDTTMVFSDNFDDVSINTSKWENNGGLAIVNDELRVTGNGSNWNQGATTRDNFNRDNTGYLFEWDEVYLTSGDYYSMSGYSNGGIINPAIMFYGYPATNYYSYRNGTATNLGVVIGTVGHHLTLLVKRDLGYTLYINAAIKEDDSTYANNNHNFGIRKYSASPVLCFDNLIVRKYVSPEPSVSVGEEEGFAPPPADFNKSLLLLAMIYLNLPMITLEKDYSMFKIAFGSISAVVAILIYDAYFFPFINFILIAVSIGMIASTLEERKRR